VVKRIEDVFTEAIRSDGMCPNELEQLFLGGLIDPFCVEKGNRPSPARGRMWAAFIRSVIRAGKKNKLPREHLLRFLVAGTLCSNEQVVTDMLEIGEAED